MEPFRKKNNLFAPILLYRHFYLQLPMSIEVWSLLGQSASDIILMLIVDVLLAEYKPSFCHVYVR